MRSRFSRAALLSILTLATATELAAEPFWDLIAAIRYEETETADSWSVTKELPDGLDDGATLEVTGYYVPVEAQAYVTQFLLVPDPADCPFCGSNGYGPTLDVTMTKPMPDIPEATRVTVRGVLKLDDSPETYRAVYMLDGELID